MTEKEKLSGCNSYVVCKNCGHINYFINRVPQAPNLLQKELEIQAKQRGETAPEYEAKVITCEKCGNPCNLS